MSEMTLVDAINTALHFEMSQDESIVSLTFDHRVVTGGEAARFLQAVIQFIQNH